MPELAEVYLMSDYIRQVGQQHPQGQMRILQHNNTHHPIKHSPEFFDYQSLNSSSRGKELKLLLNQTSIIFTAGMTGNWRYYPNWSKQEWLDKQRVIFQFEHTQGPALIFEDVRKFARWRYGDWDEKRGPDPMQEHKLFVEHIKNNKAKKTFATKPIYELMLDQKYFNGIGNYLRAEILYRIDSNPLTPARDYLEQNPEVLTLCQTVTQEALLLGGGTLKDWYQPGQGVEKKEKNKQDFKTWLQVYQKGASIIDKQKRKFWLDKKWLT